MTPVVYLHGFGSGPSSKKALWFGERFAQRGVTFDVPRLDAGDFEHLTISGQLQVVGEACGDRSVVLIGSSLGGYLAALYAARHNAVEKLVLMAPAFCFGRRFAATFQPGPIYHYGEGGMRNLSSQLFEDAKRYEDYPAAEQPALIFHGRRDAVVPYELSETFANSRPNAQLRLLDSDHELTDVLDLMWRETAEFLKLE